LVDFGRARDIAALAVGMMLFDEPFVGAFDGCQIGPRLEPRAA
jgi:hypothetical protein